MSWVMVKVVLAVVIKTLAFHAGEPHNFFFHIYPLTFVIVRWSFTTNTTHLSPHFLIIILHTHTNNRNVPTVVFHCLCLFNLFLLFFLTVCVMWAYQFGISLFLKRILCEKAHECCCTGVWPVYCVNSFCL